MAADTNGTVHYTNGVSVLVVDENGNTIEHLKIRKGKYIMCSPLGGPDIGGSY